MFHVVANRTPPLIYFVGSLLAVNKKFKIVITVTVATQYCWIDGVNITILFLFPFMLGNTQQIHSCYIPSLWSVWILTLSVWTHTLVVTSRNINYKYMSRSTNSESIILFHFTSFQDLFLALLVFQPSTSYLRHCSHLPRHFLCQSFLRHSLLRHQHSRRSYLLHHYSYLRHHCLCHYYPLQ